jgi:serine/threonine protein kinase/Tfp pilus assembly protein PilF
VNGVLPSQTDEVGKKAPLGESTRSVVRDFGTGRTAALSAAEQTDAPRISLPRGAQVGRYEILEEIGAGGMGVVFLARDPELDRRVAVKLLRSDVADPVLARGARSRIIREAQAQARFSHPHVVTVFDVGSFDGRLFMAMEYVPGQNLLEWIEEGSPSTAQILEALRQAGEGLAAAHAQELVHRDVKPQNIIVGEDGRVRVIDFGLAMAAGQPGESTPGTLQSQDHEESRLTMTGMVLGTPAYMAPEQQRGQVVDARSDQFSFCVAAVEVLYGLRPFSSTSPRRRLREIRERRLLDVPPPPTLPPRVHRALLRGLEPAPEDRWPSMSALLQAVAPTHGRGRVGWWALGASGVATVGLVAWSALAAQPDPCASASEPVQSAWNDARRGQVRAAFESSDRSFAPDSWARLEPMLDELSRDFADARVRTCRAHRLEASMSVVDFDRAMHCLGEGVSDLDATVEVLADGDERALQRAVRTVAGLRPASACADTRGRKVGAPEPGDEDGPAAEVRQRLAKARALERSALYDEGLAEVGRALDLARREGRGGLEAESLAMQGFLLESSGRYREAEDAFSEATWLGAAQRRDDVAAKSATELIFLVGNLQNRHEEAREWARHARAAVARTGDDSALQAHLLTSLGNLAWAQHDYATAKERFEAALELRRQEYPADHPLVLTIKSNLGMLHRDQGELDEARAMLEETLEGRTAAFGPRHPDVAANLTNLGSILMSQGDYVRAEELFRRARSIFIESHGELHPDIGRVTTNLANVLYQQGKFDEALEYHRKALEVFRETLGPDNMLVGRAHNNLGASLQHREEYEEARNNYRAALSIFEAQLDPGHPEIASAVLNIAQLDAIDGRVADALAGFDRALDILSSKLGPNHARVGPVLLGKGRFLADLGRQAEAVDVLERAVAIYEAPEVNPTTRADARFVLAQVRWNLGRDRARSVAEAKQARSELGTADDTTELGNDIDTWLHEHRHTGRR